MVQTLRAPFDLGRGGPGGWWIVSEPGIEIARAPEISPDVAGWRRDHMPQLPENDAIKVVPDWVCEVLSPRTRAYDLTIKRPFYAEIGVRFIWYVDPEARSLHASRLHEGRWLETGYRVGDMIVRAEPFEAIEIALGDWWMPCATPDDSP